MEPTTELDVGRASDQLTAAFRVDSRTPNLSAAWLIVSKPPVTLSSAAMNSGFSYTSGWSQHTARTQLCCLLQPALMASLLAVRKRQNFVENIVCIYRQFLHLLSEELLRRASLPWTAQSLKWQLVPEPLHIMWIGMTLGKSTHHFTYVFN